MHAGVQATELPESHSAVLVQVNSTMVSWSGSSPCPAGVAVPKLGFPWDWLLSPNAEAVTSRELQGLQVLGSSHFQSRTQLPFTPSLPGHRNLCLLPLTRLLCHSHSTRQTDYQHINALLLKHTAVLACAFSLPVAFSLVSLNVLSKAYFLTYAMWYEKFIPSADAQQQVAI